jgi:quercetin dioxygenase-like cupin family protein
MAQTTTALGVDPSEETIRVGPLGIHFLVTENDSNGSAAVFELTVPAGEKIPGPAHSHDAYEETVYGLEGVLAWTVDGQRIDVGPGQALCIPRGTVHRFDNKGRQDAKVLIMATPAAIGPRYFSELAAVIDASAGGPPDRSQLAEIMQRHGLTPAPPSA